MAKKKSSSVSLIRLVVAIIIVAFTVVAIVGMFVDVINCEIVFGTNKNVVGLKLFSDEMKEENTTFMIISFIVAFIGLLILIIGQGGMILKKNINFITFIGSAFAVIGGILVFISAFVLANSLKGVDGGELGSVSYIPAIGIYLTTISSLISGGLGFLSMTKVMR